LLSVGFVGVGDPPLLGRLAIDRLGGEDEHAAESTAIRASANTPGPPRRHLAELRFLHFTMALLVSKPMTENVSVLRGAG